MEASVYTPFKDTDDLKKEIERLSTEKNQYLDKLRNGENVKVQLRETRKDGKYLTKKMKRLQALADKAKEENSEQPTFSSQAESHVSQEEEDHLSRSSKPLPELQPPQAFCNSMSSEGSFSSYSEESFPIPPPPKGFSMNVETHPTFPTKPLPRAPECGVRDALALQIENRNLVTMNRKLEEQNQNLVQENAALETRCKEVESIAKNLEAETQRLSQQLSRSHIGQVQAKYNLVPHEEIQLLRAQLKIYEDDYKKEKSEKEQLNTQRERFKRELRDSQATIAGLQHQLKQALAGEGGYGAPVRIERQPYYPAYPAKHPLDYGMGRTYSGGYIGPGASNEVFRSRQNTAVKKSFLSPDMTAVIDHDVIDGTAKNAPKSI